MIGKRLEARVSNSDYEGEALGLKVMEGDDKERAGRGRIASRIAFLPD